MNQSLHKIFIEFRESQNTVYPKTNEPNTDLFFISVFEIFEIGSPTVFFESPTSLCPPETVFVIPKQSFPPSNQYFIGHEFNGCYQMPTVDSNEFHGIPLEITAFDRYFTHCLGVFSQPERYLK
jgi:hypothetical protein